MCRPDDDLSQSQRLSICTTISALIHRKAAVKATDIVELALGLFYCGARTSAQKYRMREKMGLVEMRLRWELHHVSHRITSVPDWRRYITIVSAISAIDIVQNSWCGISISGAFYCWRKKTSSVPSASDDGIVRFSYFTLIQTVTCKPNNNDLFPQKCCMSICRICIKV